MNNWDQRPIEIRNLFNPAFCGLILFRAMAAYHEEDRRGLPYSLSLLVLPLCLHKDTRHALIRGKRSYFLKIISDNPQLLVNLPERTTSLLPFTFEALGFLLQCGAFEVSEHGNLKPIDIKIKKTATGTEETIACQRSAVTIGKQFARISDRVTIYTTLGIRP